MTQKEEYKEILSVSIKVGIGTILRRERGRKNKYNEYYIVVGIEPNTNEYSCLYFKKEMPSESRMLCYFNQAAIECEYTSKRIKIIELSGKKYEIYGKVTYRIQQKIEVVFKEYVRAYKDLINYANIEIKTKLGSILKVEKSNYYLIIDTNPYKFILIRGLKEKEIVENEVIEWVIRNNKDLYVITGTNLTMCAINTKYITTLNEERIKKLRNKLKLLKVI